MSKLHSKVARNDETPTDNRKVATGRQIYARLLGYTKQHRLAFAVAVVANLIYASMEVIFTNSLKPLTDVALVGQNIEFMKNAPLFVMAILLVRGAASFVSTYCMSWVGQHVVFAMRKDLVKKYLGLPASFYDRSNSGDLISKVTFNTQQVAKASTDALTKVFREGGTVIFILISLFYYNWQLTLVFLVSAPIIGLIVNLTSKRFKKISSNIQNAMGGVTQTAAEIVNGYKIVKTFTAEKHENKRFAESANLNRQQNMKLSLTQAISVPTIQLIAGVALSFVIYFSALQLEAKTMTSGEFVVMIALMMHLLRPLKVISNINSVLQQGIAASQSIFEIIDQDDETDNGTLELNKVDGKIEFDRVNFSYPSSDKRDIDNLSLSIVPGQTVALVGKSGSGKSTLTSLLLRFYNPDSGQIRLDDIDIATLSLNSLRGAIGFVSQQIVLFDDSIAHNIAYPNKEIDPERLQQAANKAHVTEFVERLTDGFDTVVGDNGARLSGGQRQRIAIARALYDDAPILVLDEATSALDTESERHIQDALQALMENRTSIVIAHRLSTIESADKIMVMDDGKIIEEGDHQSLIASNGHYARLHQMQFSENQ